jgi:hypothetical protein
MADRYVVVGQAIVANGVAGVVSGSPVRLVPGANSITVTTLGDLTVTCAKGTTASAANGTAHLVANPTACAEAAATTITTTDTGTIIITVTYNSAGQSNNTYSYSATSGGVANASVPDSTTNVYPDLKAFTAAGQAFNIAATLSCLTMNWTGALYSPTLSGASTLGMYGNVILISTLQVTATGLWRILASGITQTFTSNGVSLATVTGLDCANSPTVSLQDALNLGSGYLSIRGGVTFVSNGNTITCGSFFTYDNALTVTLGASIINCTAWTMYAANTLTANTATINVSGTGAFIGGSKTVYKIVNLNGTAHTISGDNTFAALNFNPAGAQTITWTDGSTQTYGAMTRTGTGQITWQGSAAAGYNLAKTGSGLVVMSKMTISRAAATPANKHFARNASVDGGNNTGITFNEPPNGQIPKLMAAGVI